jgi:hypothetical protein
VSEATKLTVTCPDCESELVIDSLTGEILFHKKAREPLAGGQDLDSLFANMDQQKEEAEATFEREVKAYEDRDRLLSEKFEEALSRAREEPDDAPMLRPFDLD